MKLELEINKSEEPSEIGQYTITIDYRGDDCCFSGSHRAPCVGDLLIKSAASILNFTKTHPELLT
jgi:hypothetical protein